MIDFSSAVARLNVGTDMHTIAKGLGSSWASVRQARYPTTAPNYRKPPKQWQAGLAKMLEDRARADLALAKQLRRETKP